jgi:predicted secreted protein
MGIATGIAIYVTLWWVVLFAVLPWGVRVPDEVESGHATSAPANPRILLKFLVTSVVSALLWGAVYWIIDSGWLDPRN